MTESTEQLKEQATPLEYAKTQLAVINETISKLDAARANLVNQLNQIDQAKLMAIGQRGITEQFIKEFSPKTGGPAEQSN